MIFHFETLDDALWVIDTANLQWGRASSILSAPSIVAAEKNLAKFEFAESGRLVPMGAGVYNMDGRTPKSAAPGAGLSSVGIMSIPFEDTLVIYLRANVKIKDESFRSNPIRETKYVIMQDRAEAKPAVAISE